MAFVIRDKNSEATEFCFKEQRQVGGLPTDYFELSSNDVLFGYFYFIF